METVKDIFKRYGFEPKSAAKLGIPYCTIWQQLSGRRKIGAMAAVRYEKVLGIPRWEMRPDLWPPPCAAAKKDPNGEEATED